MEKYKTIVEWEPLFFKLPPVDDESPHESIVVLATDGEFFEMAVYNYKSQEWHSAELGEDYRIPPLHFWCEIEKLSLPRIPQQPATADGKYTLKQLRQAWGAGFCVGQAGGLK